MTNEQLIVKFSPKNGLNLTAEDLEAMRNLTDDQIDVLADAYPNQPTRTAYLRLYDTSLPADKQIYQLSTWQNLRNVRKFSNKKNLRPYDFYTRNAKAIGQNKTVKATTTTAKKVVVDLTAKEAAAELTKNLTKPTPTPAPVVEMTPPAIETPAPVVEQPAPAEVPAPEVAKAEETVAQAPVVDNTKATAAKVAKPTTTKPASSKGAAAKKAASKQAPENGDKGDLPADQQFAEVN